MVSAKPRIGYRGSGTGRDVVLRAATVIGRGLYSPHAIEKAIGLMPGCQKGRLSPGLDNFWRTMRQIFEALESSHDFLFVLRYRYILKQRVLVEGSVLSEEVERVAASEKP